jgi:hypothetical protein
MHSDFENPIITFKPNSSAFCSVESSVLFSVKWNDG